MSCSNSFSKCWLVKQSASTSSVLARTVSNETPGGRLSTSPAGLASLEDWRCSCLCSELIPLVAKRSALFVKELMMLFQLELGLSMLDLLGWSADFVRWTPLQKKRKKKDRWGLARCLSDA